MSSRPGSQHQIAGNLDGAWIRAAQDPHSLPFQRLAAVDALSRHYARVSRFSSAVLAVGILGGGTLGALAPGSHLVLRIVAGLLALAGAGGAALIAREGATLSRALQGWLAVGRERTIPLGSVLRGLGKARMVAAIGLLVAALTWVVLLAVGALGGVQDAVGLAAAIVLPAEAVTVAAIILLGFRRLSQGAKGVLPSQQRSSTRPAQDHTFSPQPRHAPTGPVLSVNDPAEAGYSGAFSGDPGQVFGGQGYGVQTYGGQEPSDSGSLHQGEENQHAPHPSHPNPSTQQPGFRQKGSDAPAVPPVVAAVPWSAAPAPVQAPAAEPFVAIPAFVAEATGNTGLDDGLDQTTTRPPIRAAGARVLVSDSRGGVRRELTQGSYLVGRAPVARQSEEGWGLITLEDRGVSKTHLALEIVGEAVYLIDRASTNGTTLRGAGGVRTLNAWDRVELGPHDQAVVGSTVLMRAE